MEYTLGQLFKWTSGKPITPSIGNIPVYGSNGIIGYTDTPKYENKIILGRVGAYCGSVSYCNTKFNATDNTLITTCDTSKIEYYFAYYLLKLFNLNRFAGGSAQPLITQSLLKHLKCDIPDLPTQRKIASILSTYDNLIENNTKRIKLLEQMAENLYKEWFVRFRFPGHENVQMENGLPKGWKQVVASSVIDIMSGGTPKTERNDFYGGCIPFYTPKDANDSIFIYNTLTNITEEGLTHCNSQYYPVNTLMITARGTVGKLSLLAVPMAMNQSCFALQFKTKDNPYYLYYTIKTEVARLKKMANGGVFDTIVVKTFDHIKITLPSNKLLEQFNVVVTPMLEQIKNLQQQTTYLSKQRNLLLPRLMSGKLEVKP